MPYISAYQYGSHQPCVATYMTINENENVSSSVARVTFPVLSSYAWRVATMSAAEIQDISIMAGSSTGESCHSWCCLQLCRLELPPSSCGSQHRDKAGAEGKQKLEPAPPSRLLPQGWVFLMGCNRHPYFKGRLPAGLLLLAIRSNLTNMEQFQNACICIISVDPQTPRDLGPESCSLFLLNTEFSFWYHKHSIHNWLIAKKCSLY